jgi:hypothetical protein
MCFMLLLYIKEGRPSRGIISVLLMCLNNQISHNGISLMIVLQGKLKLKQY